MRKHLVLTVGFLIIIASVVNIAATVQQRDYDLRGYVNPVHDSRLPFRIPRLGVNVELTQYSSEEMQKQFGLMEIANIVWLRQEARWNEIETKPGEYDWSEWDRIVTEISRYPNKLQLVAVLVNSPDWNRHPEAESISAPPLELSSFTAFSRQFAERYGHLIDYYQIWDEPNLTSGWGYLPPSASGYLALLAQAFDAIHSADPVATIIAAALAPTTETGPQNINDITYLDDLYALGASQYMDAAAGKPYGFDQSPDNRDVSSTDLNFSRLIALREVMQRNGDAHKTLWASNWGWNTLPHNWEGTDSIWGQVSPELQAQYTQMAIERAEREWPWIGGMIIEHWQPNVDMSDPGWGFAIIDSNDTPTPLWSTLKELPALSQAQNGLYAATNPFIHYSGVWSFGQLGSDIGWVQDSQFEFNFSGSELSLLLRRDDYRAYLYPTIDGQPANAVPQDASGNSYIILTSASLRPEINLVPVAEGLQPKNHTLHVVADRGWDRWSIVGLAVSDGDLALPYQNLINISVITLGISFICVLSTAYTIDWRFSLRIPLLSRYFSEISQIIIGVASSVALLVGMMLAWGDGVSGVLRKEPISLAVALATIGLMRLEPGIIISVAAAFILLVIAYNHIHIGLALVIFWAPFFLFPVELYRYSFPLSEILIGITVSAWLLKWFHNRSLEQQALIPKYRYDWITRILRQLNALDYAVAIWLLAGFISITWSEYRQYAITDLRVNMIEPVLFYVVFRTSRLSNKQVLFIIDAMIIAGLAVAVIGLWQYANGQAIITAEDGARRLASVYGSPNNAALFLGRCIPFLLTFGLLKFDLARRLFAFASLIPITIAVILTQSVGALFLGIPISIIVVTFSIFKKHRKLLLLLIVLCVIVAFLLSLQSARFGRVLDFSSGTNFFRLRVWQSALHVIEDHPFTGIGLDQFLYAFRGRYILPDAWQEPNLSHPHNIVLDFWVRLGVLGVIAISWIMFVFMKQMRDLYQKSNLFSTIQMSIIIGCIGSMANLIAHGLVDNSVYVADLSIVFGFLLGISSLLTNMRSIDEESI